MAQAIVEPELIEWIVQEVVRRLLGQGVDVKESAAGDNSLIVEDRVVTLATLDGRLHGISRLQVKSVAVVTPAAKDKLRELRIELCRSE